MKKSVSGMKFLPHESMIERMVAASKAHFTGPFTTNNPNTKSMSTKAPTYTGPLVPGCSPQYCPNCW